MIRCQHSGCTLRFQSFFSSWTSVLHAYAFQYSLTEWHIMTYQFAWVYVVTQSCSKAYMRSRKIIPGHKTTHEGTSWHVMTSRCTSRSKTSNESNGTYEEVTRESHNNYTECTQNSNRITEVSVNHTLTLVWDLLNCSELFWTVVNCFELIGCLFSGFELRWNDSNCSYVPLAILLVAGVLILFELHLTRVVCSELCFAVSQ